MSQVTGKERVLAAFNREYADRVPMCIAAAMNCVEEVGFSLEDFLLDDDIAMKVTARALELFPSDLVRVPGDPTLPIIADARYRKKHGANARMEPLLKDKSRINEISFQEPKKSQTYRKYLDLCRMSAVEFGDRAVQALFPGPWTGAANFRGIENIIIDTADDPDFVHRLMRITTDLAKARGLALLETGILMVVAGDPSASCSLISPRIYREFIKPYHRELMDHLREEAKRRGAFVGLHICGYIDPIMEELMEVEPDFIEIDGPSSLKKMVEISKKRVVIRGNIPSELFLQGERDDMERTVKQCIEIAARGSAYILSHGCALPPNAPLERIRWYMEAGLRYGTY